MPVRFVAAGQKHTCAVLEDETVRCWGEGVEGQLGYGNTENGFSPSELPSVSLGDDALTVSADGTHTCAILADGRLRCWGNGASGRLGYGNTNNIGDNEAIDSVPTVPVF